MSRDSYLNNSSNPTRACGLVLLSCLFAALMSVFVKISHKSISMPEILFCRYATSLALALVVLKIRKQRISKLVIRAKHPTMQIARATVGFASLALFFASLKTLSLSSATLLFSTAPILVPIISRIWLNVKLQTQLWPYIFAGFIGVCLILRPNMHFFAPGAIYALLSGIGSAIVLIATRLLAYDEDDNTTIIYDLAVGTTIGLVASIASHGINSLTPSVQLAPLLVGIFGYAYISLMILSAKYAPARLSAPFTYATVLFSFVFDWLIWGHSPTTITLLGTVMIITSGIALLRKHTY